MTGAEGLTAAQIDRIRSWTPVDEDLGEVNPNIRELFRTTRLQFATGDLPRSERWETPGGVDVVSDIPYLDDGRRAHLLDLYLPHDAVLRRGTALPVYIDIHGGGFHYGYKELNKNFCVHLAERGFAVFSLNYRLTPVATFSDQLSDIAFAFAWIAEHLDDYPVDPDALFVTGDSAGGTLGLYSLAATRDATLARALGLPEPALSFRGAAFISGLFDLAPLLSPHPSALPYIDAIRDHFFGRPFAALPRRYRSIAPLVEHVSLPPIFLNTCSDDFLEAESLLLAAHLARVGSAVEVEDAVPAKGAALGHVYPVGMTWLDESHEVLSRIHDFSYRLIP